MRKNNPKTKKSVLGKGMAALLQSTTATTLEPETSTKKRIKENHFLLINKLVANKDQPRKIFKNDELEELRNSIKENGIIQPILVRPLDDGMYEIIAGERRFRAAKLAGLVEVPVVIKKATTKEMSVMAIIENVQRSDLNCVEEALAYYHLLNEFKLTQEEVAKKIGKKRSSVTNSLRLLKLPKSVLALLKEESLSLGHGKVLASVKESDLCEMYAREVVRNELSVRDLENLIKEGEGQSPVNHKKKKKTKAYDRELDQITQELERKTGFHLNVKRNAKGAGSLQIKFTDKVELNSIIEYFLNKK